MGIIRSLIGGLTGQGQVSAVDLIEAFRVNAEADAQRSAAHKAAALSQLSTEFQTVRPGRFNQIMYGINRVPRPAMALGVLGLFLSAMISPEWFIARMHGLLYVPEPLWWLLGVIVPFYFGARFQAREQHMLQEMARGMQVKLHHHERDIPSQKVDDPSPIQMSSPTPDSAGNPLENRALSDWYRAKVR